MREVIHAIRWSAWLGWQIESNWTSPWRFLAYLLVKPLTGALLLAAMYWAARTATGGAVPTGYLPFLYVGYACFLLVGSITSGMSWAIVQDRDQYGTLKLVYLSPAGLECYLSRAGIPALS